MSVARNVNIAENSSITGREVLCITIPVTENMRNVSDFTNQFEYYYRRVADTIGDFIDKSCMKLGFTSYDKKSQAWIGELVANSYDAYAAHYLEQGSSLKLKVVIQSNEKFTVIKFKDNASGFIGYPKSASLNNELICSIISEKSSEYLGGAGLGLSCHIQCVRKAGGIVQLKNRKKEGASIYSIFYHNDNKIQHSQIQNAEVAEKESLLKI